MGFYEQLHAAANKNNSWICVGLDTDLEKIPPHLVEAHGHDAVVYFNQAIIEATQDLVCSYKPNSAFYEALGPMGLEMLKVTRELIPRDIPMILDAKRGDMGNTSVKYAQAVFEIYEADAVTLNPYQGFDTIEPFAKYEDRGLIILTRTSNPSSRDLQDLVVGENPIYVETAKLVDQWRQKLDTKNVGAVVGATQPDKLREVRAILGNEALILVPGIGAQGGSLEAAVKAGTNSQGESMIVNASRSIIYASSGEDFAEAARAEAGALRDALNAAIRTT